MKRLLLGTALAGAVLLLSACPDTKLPTPAPRVPEPKARQMVHFGADILHARGLVPAGSTAPARRA